MSDLTGGRQGAARAAAKKRRKRIWPPARFTPEIQGAIERGVEAGLSPTRAGILAGVSAQTLSDWRVRFPQLAAGIEAARERGLARRLTELEGATGGIKAWAGTYGRAA